MIEEIEKRKASYSDRQLLLVLLAIAILLIQVPNFVILKFYIKNYQSTDDWMVCFVLPLISLALAILFPILVVPKFGRFDCKWFRWTRDEFFWFWFLPLGIIISVVIVRFLVHQLRLPSATPIIRFMTGSYLCYYMPLYIWLIIRTCVLTPIVEEFFWRGYVQSTLLKISHPILAIFGQATLFGLVHFRPLLGFLQISLLGMVFGIWCYRRKTLLPVIIIHITINCFVFTSGLYDRREISQVKVTKNYVTEFIELSKPDSYTPNEDAREQYREAFRLVKKIPTKLEEILKRYPNQWSSEEITIAEAWLSSNTQPLSLIEEGTKKPYFWIQYQRRYNRMPVLTPGYLNKMKDVIFAMCMQATLKAYQGQFVQSLRHIETCSKLGNHLVANKDIVPKLHGLSCYAKVIRSMRIIMANENIDSEDLINFQNRFKMLTEHENFEFDFTSERFMLLEAVQIMFTDDGQGRGHIPRYFFNRYLRYGEFEYVNSIMSIVNNSDIKKWKRLKRRETTTQVERYYKLLNIASSCSPWQYERNYQNVKTNFEQIKKENPLIKTFSIHTQLFHIPWRARVDLDALITTLGILRYKADNHQYPDSLSELVVKGYIEAVPDDPYSDGQIVYKRIDNGFILYSLGADFDDDGGTPSKWGEGDIGGDQVFWPVEGTDEYIEIQQ